jgi:hypothetical protein
MTHSALIDIFSYLFSYARPARISIMFQFLLFPFFSSHAEAWARCDYR